MHHFNFLPFYLASSCTFSLPSPLHHSIFAARFGSCLLSFIRCLLRGTPAASPAVYRLCSLHAVAVCRNLLSDTHWRHGCHVARQLAIAEDGEPLAFMHEKGLMTKPYRNKQANGSKTTYPTNQYTLLHLYITNSSNRSDCSGECSCTHAKSVFCGLRFPQRAVVGALVLRRPKKSFGVYTLREARGFCC